MSEEQAQGGHPFSKHVGRTPEELIRRADHNRIGIGKYGIWEDRYSSFRNLMIANSFVNEVLSRSTHKIEAVVSGQVTKVVLKEWFDKPTGYESYRRKFYDNAIIRETRGVLVVVKRAPHLHKGFLIQTAYPINP